MTLTYKEELELLLTNLGFSEHTARHTNNTTALVCPSKGPFPLSSDPFCIHVSRGNACRTSMSLNILSPGFLRLFQELGQKSVTFM